MVYKFFMAQWKYSCKQDWAELVRKDLEDFDIPADFSMIKSKSANSFKTLVSKKAKVFAFRKLMSMKSNHSKLKDLDYNELKMQDYLKQSNLSVEETRIIFGFRTRMAPFGKNFKKSATDILCPLCEKHEDSQEAAFQCQFVLQNICISGSFDELYTGSISKKLVQTLRDILNLRNTKVKCLS